MFVCQASAFPGQVLLCVSFLSSHLGGQLGSFLHLSRSSACFSSNWSGEFCVICCASLACSASEFCDKVAILLFCEFKVLLHFNSEQSVGNRSEHWQKRL